MPELTPFEERLAELLEADSMAGVRPADRYAIARSVIEVGGGRWWAGPFATQRLLVPVVLGLLIALLAATALLVGTRPFERTHPAPLELTLTPTGAMAHPRSHHAATLLADGRVLVTGGHNGRDEPGVSNMGASGPAPRTNFTAELYDPASRSFVATGDLVDPRLDHTSTLLRDGRVLIVGGAYPAAEAELYDPQTRRFTPTGPLAVPRSKHAAVTLADGTVAIIGGLPDPGGSVAMGAEVYDPATGSFRQGAVDPLLAREDPSVVLLPDGWVLVAGGLEMDRAVFEHAAIWDPTTDAVRDLGALPGAPFRPGQPHVAGLTSLPDGRVLLLLLDDERGEWTVQTFDPEARTFTFLGDLPGRPVLDPAVMGDGRVLLALDDATSCRGGVQAAVFDPGVGRTRLVGEVPRFGTCHGVPASTVTVVDGGSALIAGGNTASGDTLTDAAIVSWRAGR